jgi:hypothetical protein
VRPFMHHSPMSEPVVANDPEADGSEPAVAMGPDDSFLVAWIGRQSPSDSENTVLGRYFNNRGEPLTPALPIAMGGYDPTSVRVATAPDGGFLVVWNSMQHGALMMRRVSPAGVPVGSQMPLDTEYSSAQPGVPKLAIDANGNFAVQYEREDAETFAREVRLAVFGADASRRSESRLTSGFPGIEFGGDVAMDADGDITTTWSVSDDAEGRRLLGARLLHGQPIDLALDVGAPSLIEYGAPFTYRVTVRNQAPWSGTGQGDTAGFILQLTLPANAQFWNASGSTDWACENYQVLFCTYAPSLPGGAESTPLFVYMNAPMEGNLRLDAELVPRHDDPDPGNDQVTLFSALGDLTTDPFAFQDRTGVARSAWQESNEIVVSGVDGAVDAQVYGGEMSVDGSAWTTHATSVVQGARIRVRHQSSAGFGASIDTTLYVTGASDTFTTTTEARDTTPDAFAFADQADAGLGVPVTSAPIAVAGVNDIVAVGVSGGSYSLNGGAFTSAAGTARAGDTIRVRHTAATTPATATHTVLTVGGVSDTFTSTTVAPDTTPDPFAFAAQSAVAPGSERTSADVQISGINTAAPISASGGSYSIDGAPFTASAGTIGTGQRVRLRHVASAAFSTATTTQLTIGTASASFTSTTLARDVTPDAFAFAAQAGVPRGSERISAEVTIAGINDAAAVTVNGGSYSIDGAAFTSAAGTIGNGQRLRLRHTAAGSFGATTTTTVTVGTANAVFSSTTETQDSVPDAFAFVDREGIATAVEVISDPVAVAGINVAVPVSVSGGSYSINGGSFASAAGTVAAGDQVRVRHVSAAGANAAVTTTLTIGGVSDGFTSTTGASDSTPNAYVFADVSGAKRNKAVISAPVTVSGINVAVPVSVAGGAARWSKNGGAYTSAAGSVVNGDVVRLQLTTPNTSFATVNVQVSIGGVADTWSVSTGN